MKNFILYACVAVLFSSCSFTRIANLTMVSTRNIDSQIQYVELMRYVEATSTGDVYHTDANGTRQKMDFKHYNSDNTAELVNQAIDFAVRSVAGGEFMKNLVVYVSSDGRTVKVTGDVWGPAPGTATSTFENSSSTSTPSSAGTEKQSDPNVIKVGDTVSWRVGNNTKQGTVTQIKGSTVYITTDSGVYITRSLSDITKVTK